MFLYTSLEILLYVVSIFNTSANAKSSSIFIQGAKKLIATVGLEDIIVVDTEDATLICAKDSTADIKKVIENLKICNRDEYI